jgi:hypothetical protein
MARTHKPTDYRKGVPPRPVDDALIDDIVRASGGTYSAAARDRLRDALNSHNALPTAAKSARMRREAGLADPRGGRSFNANLHALVHQLVCIFEREIGADWTLTIPVGGGPAQGPVADMLRAAWDGLRDPRVSRDGIGRLAETVVRYGRRERKRVWEAYDKELRDAWQKPQSDEDLQREIDRVSAQMKKC